MDSVPYKTADVHNIIFNLDEENISCFILEQEEKGTSYELLEDITAHISDLSSERAKIIVKALLLSMQNLNQTVHKSWFSMSTGAYAERMMLDLIERIHSEDRFGFISELISDGDMDMIQSIANIINMLELGYGRLAANGQERNYKKVITLEELLKVETLFTTRVKEILNTHSLFDFTKWYMVHYLVDSFDPEYMKTYLDNVLIEDENVLKFLGRFVTVWTGSGIGYEVQTGYAEYFSVARILDAIETCKKDGIFFSFPEELQHKCAAFFINNSGNPEYVGEVYQCDTEKIIASWKLQ